MLIIFGGLSGVGKTTISRKLAERIGAVYIRVDTIETAIISSAINTKYAHDAGYLAAYGIAQDNLSIGRTVVADSVNPIKATREAWREVAKSIGKDFIEIEVVCSDINEHKKRVEERVADIKGHTLPIWKDVLDREYEDWNLMGIRIDSASNSVDRNIENIIDFLSQQHVANFGITPKS